MVAFTTEVELGARGTGFSEEEIAEARATVAAAHDVVKTLCEMSGMPHDALVRAQQRLDQARDRHALMVLHNRLRAVEASVAAGPDPRYFSAGT